MSIIFLCLIGGDLPRRSVTFAFLGDVMLGRSIAHLREEKGWPETMGGVRPILLTADMAAINLESPFGESMPRDSEDANLTAPAAGLAALTSAGVDVVSVANNHSLDAGPGGVEFTRSVLEGAGMAPLGNRSSVIRRIHGMTITFIGANILESGDRDEALIQAVAMAHREGSWTVVSIHWGMEFQSGPSQEQQHLAERLAEAGADIVWGHHPHVVQRVERIGLTWVLYSLGNAVFDQIGPNSARVGAVVWLRQYADGSSEILEWQFPIDPTNGSIGTPHLWPVFWRVEPGPPLIDSILGRMN